MRDIFKAYSFQRLFIYTRRLQKIVLLVASMPGVMSRLVSFNLSIRVYIFLKVNQSLARSVIYTYRISAVNRTICSVYVHMLNVLVILLGTGIQYFESNERINAYLTNRYCMYLSENIFLEIKENLNY